MAALTPEQVGCFSQENLAGDESYIQGNVLDPGSATPAEVTASYDNPLQDSSNTQEYFIDVTYNTEDDPSWSPADA